MVAGGPAKCSRFDEFNGVPTEKLIRGETTKKKRRSIKHLPHLELSSIEINKLYLSNCPLELDVACVLLFECTFIIEGPCTSATPSHTCSFFLLSGELTSLNLGSCGLGPAEACLVGLLLCQPRCTITTALDLSWNAEIGADGLKALAHSLAHARSPLRSLNLSGKAISFHALLQA
jgi:hypothetical protein